MKKLIIKDNKIPSIDNNIACIGYFDGVHVGHQKLISFTVDLAKKNNLKSMVICFDPDPNDVIKNTSNNHLLSLKDRLESFKQLGVDIVCVISFDEKTMKIKAEGFIKKYLLKLNINTLVCGFDFTYGYKGIGDASLLSNYLNTIVIDEIKYRSLKISSSRIKELLLNGKLKQANRLLGYKYSLFMKVISKDKNTYKLKVINNSLLKPLVESEDFYLLNNYYYYLKTEDLLKINDEILMVFDYE